MTKKKERMGMKRKVRRNVRKGQRDKLNENTESIPSRKPFFFFGS